MGKPKDVFEKVPEFLAAFRNISENGFFESLALKVDGRSGRPACCTIQGTGYVPKTRSNMAEGVGTLIDPHAIIDRARALAAKNRVKSCSVEVETKDWELWDKAGMKVIGTKGMETTFQVVLSFKF